MEPNLGLIALQPCGQQYNIIVEPVTAICFHVIVLFLNVGSWYSEITTNALLISNWLNYGSHALCSKDRNKMNRTSGKNLIIA